MASKEMDFLVSACTTRNPFIETNQIMDWFYSRRKAHEFRIEEIPFDRLINWSFEPSTGNLVHTSGKFFSIVGLWVETNFGPVNRWSQPIINQPEVGILGFLTKKFNGVLHFLMQVKMEPGNINTVQLAPTLQATRSNYTRVHQGKSPSYLEYFLDRSTSRVLVDSLQSEQGARFLRKRNRNIIIETTIDVPVLDDYCWLTLRQIHAIIQNDNVINMDARTVLSTIPFAVPELRGMTGERIRDAFASSAEVSGEIIDSCVEALDSPMLASVLAKDSGLHSLDEVISWFTELKIRYALDVEVIPLKFVKNWIQSDRSIHHEDGLFFSVIAVGVEAENREVPSWTQPIVKPQEEGIVAYFVKKIDGVIHFLAQAKVEPGNFDVVEIAPSVQCITGSHEGVASENRPPFLDYALSVPEGRVLVTSRQSEEGGRFYREENRNMVIDVDDDFPDELPDNYIWISLDQLKTLIRFNNFVNVEARCLLSCLGFARY